MEKPLGVPYSVSRANWQDPVSETSARKKNTTMARWIWNDDERPKDSPPRSLFKYYSPSGVLKTIRDNTFKWELPCDENDPFEALARGWDELAIGREIGSAPIGDKDTLDALFKSKRLQDKISHIVAFVSFAERGNNLLMWSHYAEKHTGACIEFDTAILETIDCFAPVKYDEAEGGKRLRIPLPRNDRGDREPKYQEEVRKFLSHKANEWAYEEEWRWIVPPMADCITPILDDDKCLLVSTIPQDAIKQLIFGYNMPVSTRLALAKLIRKNHKSCTFAEIVPDQEKYLLSIEPLDIDPYS